MNLRQTPYPKPSFGAFMRTITGVSATIVFILVVFQPFGTSDFQHPYKYLMLFGYGLNIFLTGMLVYGISLLLIPEQRLDKWSVLDEVVFLFLVIILCQVVCYFYWVFLFSTGFRWNQFRYFFIMASTVSIVPVSVYLLFIYQKYKEIKFISTHSPLENTLSNVHPNGIINLQGVGKNENIRIHSVNLIMIKSEDNYVIIYLLEKDKLIKRIMRNTMAEIEQQVGSSFFRCHRSYIINPDKIIHVEGNITNTRITLANVDLKIPVSRSLADKVKSMISEK